MYASNICFEKWKSTRIEINSIKFHPSQNQPDQNPTEPKPTRLESTCLIQPKSTQGQNCISHVCNGVDF